MTELTSVVGVGDQLPSQQIARRIRAHMAVHQITGLDLARQMSLTQRSFSRRYRGQIEWSVDELSQLAQILRLSFAELTEHDPVAIATPDLPAPDGGRGSLEYAIRDSNPEPADCLSGPDATVIQMPRRPHAHTHTSTTGGRGATVVRLEARASRRATSTSTWCDEVSS